MSEEISLKEIIRARAVIYRYLKPTPLIHYRPLSEITGFHTYIKHENHNPTGAFKIRGGLNLIASLPQEEKKRGVITATRGNHGQSIAMASRIFGVPCTIVVPHENNPEKNRAMRCFGAELVEYGRDFDEARQRAEEIRGERRLRYIHPANEPLLVNGVGTYSLEIFDDLPDVETIIVPIGGGSGACGAITVARALNPTVRVIGVQAERAPSVYLSWREGRIIETERSDTFADGLATRVPFEMTFNIIRRGISDIVTASEEEIKSSIRLLLETTHNLAEGAGAAPLAAALKMRDRLRDKKVVIILTGGNIDVATLKWVLMDDKGYNGELPHGNTTKRG
ncbi:MAG: threonine dehydratase [Syntrophobacterales bacterium]|nr:MAG: threonine dehydratase [Syntrophobacterales bacterium]